MEQKYTVIDWDVVGKPFYRAGLIEEDKDVACILTDRNVIAAAGHKE